MPPLGSIVAIGVTRIAGAAWSSAVVTRAAVITASAHVTVVIVATSPTLKVAAVTFIVVIAVAAKIRPTIKSLAAVFVIVGIRSAVVPVAIEIRLSALIAIEIRPAIHLRRATKVGPAIKSWAPVGILTTIEIGPPIKIRTVKVAWWRAIEVRTSAPPVTVPIKIAVAIVAVPIIAYAEDDRRNSKRAVIFRAYINTTALI